MMSAEWAVRLGPMKLGDAEEGILLEGGHDIVLCSSGCFGHGETVPLYNLSALRREGIISWRCRRIDEPGSMEQLVDRFFRFVC